MLPKGWLSASVASVCETVSVGIVVNPSDYYVSEERGVKAFRSGNVRENKVQDDRWVYLSEEGHIKNKKSVLQAGDVLIVRTGFAGTACVVPQHLAGSNCIDVLFARPKPDRLLPEYLSELTNSEVGRRQVFSGQTGLAQKHLNVATYSKMSFGLPPLDEQRRIIEILSTWNDAIAVAERLIVNCRRLRQSMLHHLVRKPASQARWPMLPISAISTRVQRRIESDEAFPVLMISSGSGFVRQDEKYSRFMAGKSLENYVLLEEGEFAYNKGNSKRYEFGCIFPLKSHERGLVPHVYVCFRLNPQYVSGFFEQLFAADFLHDQLGALVNTGVRNNGLLNIRPHDFMACSVPIPPLEDQTRIADTLATATQWMEKQEAILVRLKQEKAALMAVLLTGRRRVHFPDVKVEAQT